MSDVSHELKTPLAKIRLLIALVEPGEKIQKIDRHIDYLDSIITNILISDKLTMPYTNLEIDKIKIQTLINQGIELSKNKNVVCEKSNLSVIKCDIIKIAIVIKNLLDNAEKYAPSSRAVEITSNIKGSVVSISVRDFGPGIDAELIQKITEPYVRGKTGTQPGFGLGLSICKKVMVSHGGFLNISNHPDQGCSFTISWDYNKL